MVKQLDAGVPLTSSTFIDGVYVAASTESGTVRIYDLRTISRSDEGSDGIVAAGVDPSTNDPLVLIETRHWSAARNSFLE